MKLSPKTPEAAKAFDDFHFFFAISRYTWPIDREQWIFVFYFSQASNHLAVRAIGTYLMTR